MFLFKRILDFLPGAVAKMEQRLNTRYTPGDAFPLHAQLVIGDREFPVRVLNISGKGLGVLLETFDPPKEGSPARVRLRFGRHEQVLDAKLVYVRPGANGVYCGVGLKFADFPAQKTYLQLLQPVAIGQSLEPVAAELVIQDEPRFTKKVFRSEEDATLTVWVEKDSPATIYSFEFLMHDYVCHVDGKSSVLEAYAREDAGSLKDKLSNPVFDISGSLHAEIRQLFRWILPNLSPRVPGEIRGFLERFAS